MSVDGVMLTADKSALEIRHFPAVETLLKAGIKGCADMRLITVKALVIWQPAVV